MGSDGCNSDSVVRPVAVFVGDSPSRMNLDQAIPFLRTNSGAKLLEWLKVLHYWPAIIVNQNQPEFDSFMELTLSENPNAKFIALGRVAQRKLLSMGVDPHYMPHPSGRNRKLNDKNYVDSALASCYYFLHGKKIIR